MCTCILYTDIGSSTKIKRKTYGWASWCFQVVCQPHHGSTQGPVSFVTFQARSYQHRQLFSQYTHVSRKDEYTCVCLCTYMNVYIYTIIHIYIFGVWVCISYGYCTHIHTQAHAQQGAREVNFNVAVMHYHLNVANHFTHIQSPFEALPGAKSRPCFWKTAIASGMHGMFAPSATALAPALTNASASLPLISFSAKFQKTSGIIEKRHYEKKSTYMWQGNVSDSKISHEWHKATRQPRRRQMPTCACPKK